MFNRFKNLHELREEYNKLIHERGLMFAATPYIRPSLIERLDHRIEAIKNCYNRKKYWFMVSL